MRCHAYFDYSARADGSEPSWGMVVDFPGHLQAFEAGGRLTGAAGEDQACMEALKALLVQGIEEATLICDDQTLLLKKPELPDGFNLKVVSRENAWHRRAHDLARTVRETGEEHFRQTPRPSPQQFAATEEELLNTLEERGAVEQRVRRCVTTVPQTIRQIQETSGASSGYVRLILDKMTRQGGACVTTREGRVHATRIPATPDTDTPQAAGQRSTKTRQTAQNTTRVPRPHGAAHLNVTVKSVKRRSRTVDFLHIHGGKYRIGKRPDHELIDMVITQHARTPAMARWLRQETERALEKRRREST